MAVYLSYRRRRLHPLLLLCISALSFSWIESPYDWAMYAQFPPGLPRMPSWWPLNMTWGGGLPLAVPIGYISYFVLPALIGAALGRWLSVKFHWRRPQRFSRSVLSWDSAGRSSSMPSAARYFGNFYYGYVIPGLAIFEGTKHQYPLYDSLAMGIEMMVFTYLLGRTDAEGRNVIEMWSDSKAKTRVQSSVLSIVAVVVVGHLVYGAVFAPHLITKLGGWVTAGPTEAAIPGHAQPAPLAEGRS